MRKLAIHLEISSITHYSKASYYSRRSTKLTGKAYLEPSCRPAKQLSCNLSRCNIRLHCFIVRVWHQDSTLPPFPETYSSGTLKKQSKRPPKRKSSTGKIIHFELCRFSPCFMIGLNDGGRQIPQNVFIIYIWYKQFINTIRGKVTVRAATTM